tara:strand:- start:478 stop:762 length:285 start_codon:yes stop_codon:yes gene_type:complete
MVFPVGGEISKSVAVEFRNGRKLLSLALDNSCGRMEKLSRTSLRVFLDDEESTVDVTPEVFPNLDSELLPVWASLENFETAMAWLRRTTWGFGN